MIIFPLIPPDSHCSDVVHWRREFLFFIGKNKTETGFSFGATCVCYRVPALAQAAPQESLDGLLGALVE